MNFAINFEAFLTLATIVTGIVYAVDQWYWSKKRGTQSTSVWIVNSREFFPVLFLVLLLRSFLVEPFRIPTGSLEPSLIPGDFVAVNKFDYGLRLPVIHTKILAIGQPQHADIAVFRWPRNTHIDFIKRVIGLPGDTIRYDNKVLYINGVEQPQQYIGSGTDREPGEPNMPMEKYQETLNGVKHDIFINPMMPAQNFTMTVPAGEYFMMGDNRDDSDDSRYWGCVPDKDLVGKAFLIWFSWAGIHHGWVHWSRLGTMINRAPQK